MLQFLNVLCSVLIVSISLSSCNENSAPFNEAQKKGKIIENDAAQYFSISELGSKTSVETLNPWHLGSEILPLNKTGKVELRIVLLSSAYLCFFNLLNEGNSIVGISDPENIFDPGIQKRWKNGKIQGVGLHNNPNLESIIALKPDLIIADMEAEKSKELEKLNSLGFPVFYVSAWKESSALARAEWIKVFGIIFKKKEASDLIYREIKGNYNKIRKMINPEKKTEVLLGGPFKGTWYMPAGSSYLSGLIQDAGGTYQWEKSEGTGSLTLSFEQVYSRQGDTPLWITTDVSKDIPSLVENNKNTELLQSVKNGKVFNIRIKGKGSEYFESSSCHPDLVLKDLVKILHPELLPGHSLHYFTQLTE